MPGPLMSLHANPELAEVEVIPGICFAAKKQYLDELVLNETPTCKIFVGHAGWGPGQLESEINEGAWRSMAATTEIVFSQQDNLWETVLRQIGHTMLQSVLNIKNLPPDPSVN